MSWQTKRQYRPPHPGEVLSFLNRHAAHVEPGQGVDVRFTPCPVCHRDQRGAMGSSNTVSTQTGLWFCWSCRAKGNWFTLTRVMGHPLPVADRYLDPPGVSPAKIEAGWAAMRSNPKPRRPVMDGHYPELLAYCHGRGISSETLDLWRVSTKGEKALRWPIYAWREDGTEPGWQMANARIRTVLGRAEAQAAGRTVDWFEVAGADTALLLGNHLLNLEAKDGVVLLTEGQWDAMTATELGFENAFSLPNGAAHCVVAGLLRYVPEDWEVWLCVDMDEAGEKCAESLFSQLGPDKLSRIYLPAKDLNAWWMESGFTLTKAQVLSCLRGFTHRVQAVTPTPGRYLTLRGDAAAQKPQPICDTPWPTLTRLLDGGTRPRQITGLLAPSGIGKTTMVNQWMVHAAAQGCPAGLVSLEGDRDVLATNLETAIIGAHGGVRLAEIGANLLVSKLQGSGVTWKQILAEVRIMIEEGARLVAIDNLDFCMPRHSQTLANSQKVEAFSKFLELVMETGAHAIMVWQPNKIDSEDVINSGSQKGASQLLQDADNYLNLNRIAGQGRVEVEKCRSKGKQESRFLWLRYDPSRNCLDETDPPKGSLAKPALVTQE